MTIKFGTDGWRGIIAGEFNFDNVSLCAQGISDYIANMNLSNPMVLVGYDTRFLSYEFALRTVEILTGNGIRVLLCKRATPTPVISYNLLSKGACGAVIITASHNPYEWNGIKFKSAYGGSASDTEIADIESCIGRLSNKDIREMTFQKARTDGLVSMLEPMTDYSEQITRLIDIPTIRESGLKIVVDCMHGAAYGYIPVLLGLGDEFVSEIRNDHNPLFPGMKQPEPIEKNLDALSGTVVSSKADLGVAFDGDGDRLGVIDNRGDYINTQQVFSLLTLYLLDIKKQRGPVIKSVTSSDMITKLSKLYDVPLMETSVGFKHIGPLMMRERAVIGGEESGGYGFNGHLPERDGILSCLLFLEFMVCKNMSPSELLTYLHEKVGQYYYKRMDMLYSSGDDVRMRNLLDDGLKLRDIMGIPVISTDTMDGWRFRFEEGWLVVRFSGTEPLIRVYAEAMSQNNVDSLLEWTANFLEL